MRPPPPFPRGLLAALLLICAVAVNSSSAQEAQPLPTCRPSVPLPPPEPPSRPDGLIAERPPNPPITEAPLPPARPTELPSPPATAADAPPPERPTEPASPTVAAPVPPPRPPELSPGLAAPSADLPSCTPTLEAPLPPGRPAELSPSAAAPANGPQLPERPSNSVPSPALTDGAPFPPGRPPELSGDGALKLTVTPQEDTECLRSLDALGVKYGKLAPIVNGQCTVPNPLSVSVLGNGIGIGAPSTMTCRLAEGLMHWTAQVQEIADKELGDALKGLTLGGTYVCRGQNHGTEAQLSEHSFANAVDVMGFAFAKRAPLLVGTLPEGSKEAAFLSAVRKKACDHFSTVLGPGTDEPHANHLHLDERERKAGFRLCQ